MPLNANQKRHLKKLAHGLKPVVIVGQHGLRPAVLAEIEQALEAHELIKVKIAADRATRSAIAPQILEGTGAEHVHCIGQMLILFRRNARQPRIALPTG